MYSPEVFVRGGLSIAKQRLPVDLLIEGGRRLEGEVFVLPRLSERGGRETLLDLFQLPDSFLPCSTAEGTLLVQRDRVVWARVTSAVDAGVSDLAGAVETPIRLTLAGGLSAAQAEVEGVLRRWPPPDGERVLDTLAGAEAFLPLLQGESTLLVAKRYILTAQEISPAQQAAPRAGRRRGAAKPAAASPRRKGTTPKPARAR
ncbi:MAG: hypothetical protein IPL40_11075 [Proteobacteria bacterium]|nr:hypothetical protein [Pseudomonadota bacterium]